MVTLFYKNPSGSMKETTDFYIDIEHNIEASRNTFELTINPNEHRDIGIGTYIYLPEIGAGGQIRGFVHDTSTGITKFTGLTLYGILANQILAPRGGTDYFETNSTASGSVNEVITRVELDSVFLKGNVNSTRVGLYQYDRYTDVLTGLNKMLGTIGHYLKLSVDDDFTIKYDELPIAEHYVYPDICEFEIKRNDFITHMVGLGKGELKDRQVVHRFMREDGEIFSTAYPGYSKQLESVGVYDNPSVESLAELAKGVTNKLKEQSVYEVKLSPKNMIMSVGDMVHGHCEIGGKEIDVTQYVTKEIITVSRGFVTRSYEIGGV